MTTTVSAVEAAARATIAARTEQIFRESGALREGHFALKSGRHGDRYLEKFLVLQWPPLVAELCGYIAARVRSPEGERLVDVVAGPTTGGVILAFETARQLGVRGIFAEEAAGERGPGRAFRRGFEVRPRERVLLVDDILTTGGSLLAMLPPVERAGATVVRAAVLVDRSGVSDDLTSPLSGGRYPLDALWTLDLPTYEPGPASCPGCASGQPLEKPGSAGAPPPSAGG